jgi:hypothetical protein
MGNSKSQIPNSKIQFQRYAEIQTLLSRGVNWGFGTWGLGFFWDLEFGIWIWDLDLGFRVHHPHNLSILTNVSSLGSWPRSSR